MDNCEVQECPANDGQQCSKCDGYFGPEKGKFAYQAAADKKSCIREF